MDSHSQAQPSPATLPVVHGTPFSQEVVMLSKQEHIELKAQASYWKAQHGRALEREAGLGREIEQLRGRVRDL
ncbi:MAG: hypothetical protein GY717_19545, partial [Rhodobacteraceae bacterium]|nr:hypothetical protein [Paracoccaceae bacterium]